MEYNDLGQLRRKALHGQIGAGIQDLNYVYNIRGWLERINDPSTNPTSASTKKFNLGLYYNTTQSGLTSNPQYNGNISAIVWNTPARTEALSPAFKQGYGFTYDALNRLTSSVYGESTDFATSAGVNNESYTYDLNGNIKSLARYRKGTGLIDNLTYTYKNSNISNLLDKVEDASGTNGFNNGVNTTNEYSFDGSGNLTADLNKGYTSILYNYLNLPKRVGTATAGQYISYIYDAAGTKLAKVSTTGAYTYYAGNFVYSGSSLSYIIHQEGHVEPGGAYKYYIKDHLGSVRMVVNTSGTGGTIEQQTDYYPFGMTIAEYNGSIIDYRYNGKELQDDLINGKKLDWYDYGARFYDPQLGRWNVIDPMIEKHFDYSGYAYSYNNPVRFMDLMGLDTLDINYNDDGIWEITNTQMVRGDDIFRVTKDGKTTTHTFSEGEYGERVNMLNLETNDDYTLGIYHVSGAEYANGRNGYYVTPGGDASTEVGSNARLPEDTYDLQASPEAASWRQIWVTNGEANGDVSARGIKFHFGGSSPADWTKGCFVLSSAYTKNGNNIQYNFSESRTATIWMDFHLGATSVYRYATEKYNGSGRIGAQFSGTNLIHKLILKDGF